MSEASPKSIFTLNVKFVLNWKFYDGGMKKCIIFAASIY